MGSEGYLINQFLGAAHQRRAPTQWGGRLREPAALPGRGRAPRARGGGRGLHRHLPPVDARPGRGRPTCDEVVDAGASAVEAAGADIINTGIGWHEARVPDDRHRRCRARAWTFAAAARSRRRCGIPVVASNRINTPEVAEEILAARRRRPGLDGAAVPRRPRLRRQGATGRADEINTCIACNQACLDHIFAKQRATCLVNPRAGRETELDPARARAAPSASPSSAPARPASPAPSTAAERGHAVTLFEARAEHRRPVQPGAQRSPARRSSPRRCATTAARIDLLGVELQLGRRAERRRPAQAASTRSWSPPASRRACPQIPGIDHPKCVSYVDVAARRAVPVGPRVAVIGAGGIGFDVAEFLTSPPQAEAAEPAAFPRRVGRRCREYDARRPGGGRHARADPRR